MHFWNPAHSPDNRFIVLWFIEFGQDAEFEFDLNNYYIIQPTNILTSTRARPKQRTQSPVLKRTTRAHDTNKLRFNVNIMNLHKSFMLLIDSVQTAKESASTGAHVRDSFMCVASRYIWFIARSTGYSE